MEEKNYTIKEMAQRKFELPFTEIFSFEQIEGLRKTRDIVNRLWRGHKELYLHLDKARMFSLLLGKEKEWTEWYEKNKYSIGFKVLNDFFKKLKYRMCKLCDNPYCEGRADKVFCSDLCRHNDYVRRKNEKMKTPV